MDDAWMASSLVGATPGVTPPLAIGQATLTDDYRSFRGMGTKVRKYVGVKKYLAHNNQLSWYSGTDATRAYTTFHVDTTGMVENTVAGNMDVTYYVSYKTLNVNPL